MFLCPLIVNIIEDILTLHLSVSDIIKYQPHNGVSLIGDIFFQARSYAYDKKTRSYAYDKNQYFERVDDKVNRLILLSDRCVFEPNIRLIA